MSTPCDETAAIDEKVVADYLRRHPDFFLRHPRLLAELELMHETGPATSLIERQVAILRRHNRQYREQLHEWIRIARDNDRLIARLHKLTLELLDAADAARIVALLRESLLADFEADVAALHVLHPEARRLLGLEQDAFLRLEARTLPPELDKIVAAARPACGKFSDEILGWLFGEQAAPVASAALLPLELGGQARGLLAIGSHDLRRFHAEMGTAYLQHLGALVSRRLRPHFESD